MAPGTLVQERRTLELAGWSMCRLGGDCARLVMALTASATAPAARSVRHSDGWVRVFMRRISLKGRPAFQEIQKTQTSDRDGCAKGKRRPILQNGPPRFPNRMQGL